MTILEKNMIALVMEPRGKVVQLKIFSLFKFLISLFGAIFGIIGLTICFIQEKFGLIKLGNLMHLYPTTIKIKIMILFLLYLQ